MDKNTLIRTITALVVAIIDLLSVLGINLGITQDAVMSIVTVAVGIWIWWKNNDITPEAKTATNLMKQMKATRTQEAQTVEEPEDSEVIK